MTRDLRLLPVAVGAWGVALVCVLVPGTAGWLAGGCLAFAVIIGAVLALRRSAAATWSGLMIVVLAAGAAVAFTVLVQSADRDAVQEWHGRVVEAVGEVSSSASVGRDGRLWMDVQLIGIGAPGAVRPAGGPVRIGIEEAEGFVLGAVVRVTGESMATDPGERAGLVVFVTAGTVERAAPGVFGIAADLRRSFVERATRLPEPGAGLLPGLAVGDTTAVPDGVDADMRTSGLSHLTAVSGDIICSGGGCDGCDRVSPLPKKVAALDYSSYLPDGGLSILNVIALQVRSSVRQAGVLQLKGGEVRKYWSEAVDALRAAVTYLRERLHVRNSDWLPSKVQLTVLGALAMNDALYGNESIVDAWFWSSTFKGRYDVASNTRAVEDFTQLLKRVPVAPKEIGLDSETMFSVNRRQYGGLHRGLLCVYASNSPLDPFDPIVRVDEEADLASPVSFIPRSEKLWNMPGHLLTLGMLLTTSKVPRTGGYVSLDSLTEGVGTSQFVPPNPAELTVDEHFAARLRLVAEAISALAGVHTKIHTIEDDVAAEESAL